MLSTVAAIQPSVSAARRPAGRFSNCAEAPRAAAKVAVSAFSARSDAVLAKGIRRSSAELAKEMDVPSYFVALLLLVEDKRYLSHFGVDVLSVGRAVVSNLAYPDRLQGASTITQQLYDVSRSHEDPLYRRQRTVTRKICQAAWAIRVESSHSKKAILAQYLNAVYWGSDFYGIDEASLGYFDRSRSHLTPAQSFYLVEKLAGPNCVKPDRVRSLLNRLEVRRTLSQNDVSWEELSDLYRFDIRELEQTL